MPAHQFFFRRRVEFADTDVAGIVHFSNFFRYMESCEHAFYRSLGFSVHDFRPRPDADPIGWPRVHASADYRLPLFFEEEIEIELLIEQIRSKTIHYHFRFWKHPDDPDKRAVAATGKFVVVCVTFAEGSRPGGHGHSGRRMKAVAIPDEVREKIEVSPAGIIPEPAESQS
ncbi:MAG: acyl-CoA thioesterase [Verrucomicrobiae bacterium]|nr:acyl-CoA thioesterase [Verrucomicrobiae bacterium]